MRATVSDVSIRPYRLSRVEYDRAVEAGAFEPDAKLELIDGNLHAMTPEGTAHTTGIHLVADCLRRVFGSGFFVRIQNPLAVDEYSEPEPDVAVVTGTVRDYRYAHPTSAVLVVEISGRIATARPDGQTAPVRALRDSRVLDPRPPREPSRGLPRSSRRRLPERQPPCSRGQGRAARSPRRTDRRRRSATLTPRVEDVERIPWATVTT